MTSATVAAKKSTSINTQTANSSTRLLLALWSWGETEVPKGKLTERLKRKGEKSSDYNDVFSQLEDKGAIKITAGKVALLNEGKDLLGQHLKNSGLAIEGTIVGAWVARALNQWIQQTGATAQGAATNGKAVSDAIGSYEEFKQVALEMFNHLNQDYNMGNMVPVYRIRREIGNRVSRSQFNEWLFEMQSENLLQLLEESVEDGAPDKIEDSVTTKLGKLRCYVKR
ncbi:hypothetical protein [Pseudanabaena sp. FACHB-2040]|uniref:hypothetical protein n=1 Tax=Pseudanabaena sp. FACHB-2040 TaxID=2692859 RepID=UPI0016896693|nr:hypothetical protein [Pseudanabaena sp. FACHB-2040]MBD2259657.1 hypothetical protein [Pseudanabaena sp. FACHB-2040]